MKIQCQVCNKDQASVFCTADEAALCDGCDHRVHHANRLASKHQRFSLLHPSANHYPLCDICLDRRAFVFCQQDRAILCKECDLPIHSTNELTQNHNRFLLTGVKLSAAATVYSSSASSSPLTNASDFTSSVRNSVCVASAILYSTLTAENTPSTATTAAAASPPYPPINKSGGNLSRNEGDSSTTSSISEYLTQILPGWQVEDLLDSSSAPLGFSKSEDVLPLFDGDIEGNLNSFSLDNMGIWVPQAPREVTNVKGSRTRLRDDNFVVPQISPFPKRSRLLW